jgi:hypothetical protein
MNDVTKSRLPWLLMLVTIPGEKPALRMRLWRKLKASGVGVLRDGVYVGPKQLKVAALFDTQASELIAAGGSAQLLTVDGESSDFTHLFDRSAEYRDLLAEIGSAAKALKAANAKKLEAKAGMLRRQLEAIVARDFFPAALQQQARSALDELSERILRTLSPDEPHAARMRVQRLDKKEYQGRTWATRAQPWVDRLASAWLLRRFIDRKARIVWLKDPGKKPVKALGFDFDGAEFTHVDDKVTFEVLLHSFDLQGDSALAQVGSIVHYLDIGGIPAPEAPAIETILRGMRARCEDDDALLAAASKLFDDLYAGFQTPEAP